MATGSGEAHDERVIVLGRVGAPWGVHGWVRLNSYTEPRAALLDYPDCLLRCDRRWQPGRLAESKLHGSVPVARLAGVHDRDQASAWRGAEIGVTRERMPDPGAGHYYWADLEGLNVRHRDGRDLGRVAYLLATGEHDVLVVQGEREVLIPFVLDKFILDVDFVEKVISVDWEWD